MKESRSVTGLRGFVLIILLMNDYGKFCNTCTDVVILEMPVFYTNNNLTSNAVLT